MINKNWFNLENCKIINENIEIDDQEITIKRKNRDFQIRIYKYETRKNLVSMDTDIFLSENNTKLAIYQCSVPLSEKNNIPVEQIKVISEDWLINRTQLEELKSNFPEIEIFEDYQYYSKGKEAFNEYKLDQIRERLFSPNKEGFKAIIKLFDLYRKSKILKSLFPYRSVGRLCLSLGEDASDDNDYCSFYCTKEKFWLSMNKDGSEYCFNSAEETIAFLENKFQNL